MRDLTTLSNDQWEELCDGCGKCCGFRPNHVVACPGLDTTTNRCTVYEKRHDTYICLKVRPDNVEELHEVGILPDSCAYVRYWKGQEPLDRPVPAAKLIPFMLAPRDYQRKYHRANRKWLADRKKIKSSP